MSKEALKQEQGEPVAWRTKRNGVWSYHANEVHGVPNEPLYTKPQSAQKSWVGLMRGVRVEGDTVVISVHYGNDGARQLCADLIKEKNHE